MDTNSETTTNTSTSTQTPRTDAADPQGTSTSTQTPFMASVPKPLQPLDEKSKVNS